MSLRLAPIALVTLAGCATLGTPTTALKEMSSPDATAEGGLANPVPATASPIATTVPPGPFAEMTEQEAMAQVSPMLAEIAVADPELHGEVLQQLSGTKPSLWTLAVQSAQHRLAYKQQLASKGKAPTAPTQIATPKPTQPAKLPSPYTTSDDNDVVQASATVDSPATTTPDSMSPGAMPMVVAADASQQQPSVIQNHHMMDEATRLAMASKPQASSTAPQAKALFPPEPPKPTDWRGHVDAAIGELGATASSPPKSVDEARERMRLQLLHLVAGDTKQAVAPAAGLSSAEQGYWSNQLYAMSTMLDEKGPADIRTRVDAAARHQSEASANLRSMGNLQVRNFVACREVYGYGAYEPTTDGRYAPGDQVILYVELDNYRSDATAEGYRTTFDSSYRLINQAGDEVVSKDFPVVDDLCLTLRRDFHIEYAMTLPETVAPGDYRLELTVTDRLGQKIGHDQMLLTVGPR